ncbi:Rossmann-like and DUF2520 domain-containing protein [Halalkalibaculum sp. DA384]|uniref:Rossmann-like and DUF2520 domain-containing protein n=1 Tax=Halalkalibaculum sp. DA384 TaxID=3373606 RepID=UPI0037547652
MGKTVSIIGIGALGKTLARALELQGYKIYSLFNRTVSKAEDLGSELNAGIVGSIPESAGDLGELTFITVADDAIGAVTGQLAGQLWDLSSCTIAHCSGNESSEILEPLSGAGAEIAAFHPLQTFNPTSAPGIFRDIYISLEGQAGAVDQLELVVSRLGAHPLHVTPEAKSYLHAAAVMASNYLITLVHLSGEIAGLGGVDPWEARKALHALVRTTAENASAEKLSSVLSGPIARGDLKTVKKHVQLLEQNEHLASLYKRLGLETVALARQKEGITDEEVVQITKLLKD